MSAWETIPPFAIIVAALMGMGAAQGAIHKGFFGKPKMHGLDEWDRTLIDRDARLKMGEK